MLKTLLARGYLPEMLSPLFQSQSLADVLVDGSRVLPGRFTQKKPELSYPVTHSLARSGGLRRQLQIPNPLNFYRLARLFEANKSRLGKAWRRSPFSLTKPWMSAANPRALAPKRRIRSIENAARRVACRYVLKTDVSQFYSSIYTHSISWALHTKGVAKTKKGDFSLLGNKLDSELCAGQHGQTKGIPIGPDTSLALSEIIFGCVDEQIATNFPNVSGIRFIDDTHFFLETYSRAQTLLTALENELGKFELQLNLKKTSISEVPCVIDNEFVGELRLRHPRSNSKSKLAWIDYFDCAFALAGKFPYDNVMRYAVSRLGRTKIHKAAWPTAQSLLWQTLAIDPGTMRFVLDVILRNKSDDHEIDSDLARRALNHMIVTSAPAGHGSEVAWALWAFLVIESTPSANAWAKVLKTADDIVAITASAAVDIGNWTLDRRSDTWERWLVPGCFQDEHWLFSYEACRRKWVRKTKIDGLTKGDDGAVAKFLLKEGVTFLDDAAPTEFVTAASQFTFY